MTNVIKQIVTNGECGSQTIKMTVLPSERGPKGDKGDTGEAATIRAGNAYSVATDQAAVMNTGTDTHAVFDFYIPRGEKGEKGDQGDPGVVQYTAGKGIRIRDNVISVVGGGGGGGGDGVWGDIIGDIEDQEDLQEEFAKYTPTSDLAPVALSGSYADLTGEPDVMIELTSEDYDYPDDNPEGVALWRLDDGIYITKNSVKVYPATNKSYYQRMGQYIISTSDGVKLIHLLGSAFYSNTEGTWAYRTYNTDKTTGSSINFSAGISTEDIAQNFTQTSAHMVLGAAAGKTLNDNLTTLTSNVGDITTLHTTDKSSTVAAINELSQNVPTITMTTTDPGEGSALAADHYVGVYGGDPIIMDYSLNEINTGAKWIDGSAIYKKTVNFGALPNATNKTVAHQISNVSRFIKIEQSITNSGGTGALVLSSGQASNNDFNFYVTDTNISITTSGDRSTCNAYVTLYYTKSS